MGPDRRSVLLGALGAAAGAALAGCAREPGVHVPELVIATGPPGAVFREIGAEIAVLVRERLPDTEVVTVDTNASHDNLYLLEDGNAHLGLASLDSTLTHETGIAEGGVLDAVGRLYDSFVHLVVPAESAIRDLDDLAGLRVSIGSKDSGTEFTSQQILRETGLSAETVLMDQAASARALAHAILAALLWRARRKPALHPDKPWLRSEALFAIGVAAFYAVTDELHQAFEPTRQGSVIDVLIDTMGAALGILVIWMIGRWRKRW
jgi:uncharacterized protein